jgi:hypothetical protein
MSPSPAPVFPGQPSGFDSRDCVNLFFDARGDTTVRPLRPELLQLALAERERLARLQELLNQQKRSDPPANEPDAKNGAQ